SGKFIRDPWNSMEDFLLNYQIILEGIKSGYFQLYIKYIVTFIIIFIIMMAVMDYADGDPLTAQKISRMSSGTRKNVMKNVEQAIMAKSIVFGDLHRLDVHHHHRV